MSRWLWLPLTCWFALCFLGCPPPDPIGEVVTITVSNKFVTVNAEPLFPTGVYFWPDWASGNGHHPLDDIKAVGGNVVVAYYEYIRPGALPGSPQPNMAELTDAATARKIYFFVGQPQASEIDGFSQSQLEAQLKKTYDEGKRSKYFLGFMLDEPPNAGYSLALVQRYAQAVRTVAPGRLLWINFAPDTISSWHWSEAQLKTAGALADIVSGDLYPVPEGHCAGTQPQYPDCSLDDPGHFTADLARVFPQKPVWFIQQANRWKEYTDTPPVNDRFPTLAETRYMAYDAVINGARGIFFFGITDWGKAFPYTEPIFASSVPTVASELQQLAPYLISGTGRTVTTNSGDVAGIAYTLGNKTLLLLVSHARQQGNVTVTVSGLGTGSATVSDFFSGTSVGTYHSGVQLSMPALGTRALLVSP